MYLAGSLSRFSICLYLNYYKEFGSYTIMLCASCTNILNALSKNLPAEVGTSCAFSSLKGNFSVTVSFSKNKMLFFSLPKIDQSSILHYQHILVS